MRTHGRTLSAVAMVVVSTLGACSAKTNGVEVYNETDEIIRAEMLSVNAKGETSAYSSAIVNRGARFLNEMAKPVRGQSMRVRFSLAEQPQGERSGNGAVTLNLPENSVRVYSLHMDQGRLYAEEFKRARP